MWPHRYRGYGVAVVKEGFLPWTINKQKWVFYLTDSVLEFIVGYFKITIDNYTMKITRFFSWSEKEKEIAKEMINLGCLLFTQTIQLDILCININKFIKIIILLLRIPTGRRQTSLLFTSAVNKYRLGSGRDLRARFLKGRLALI